MSRWSRAPDGTLRFGIIGCGDVTEKKSGPALQKAEGSALVAVMRRDAEKAADYARRHGVPRAYSDVDALLADPDVDVVYIATPPSSHCELALRVAAAKKPCYVEKPMALDPAECEAMNRAFEAAGLPLFVAYYRRMLPRFRRIRELIHEGAIGRPRFVQASLWKPTWPPEHDPSTLPWRVKPEIAGGGHFVDLASHLIDFLDYALGPIEEARGLATNQGGLYRAEDTVSASLRFASGALASLTFCFSGPERYDMNVIAGDKGKLVFSTFGQEPVVLQRDGGQTQFDLPHPTHFQQPLIQTMVDELRGTGKCPSTGRTAARATQFVSDILREYYGGAAAPPVKAG